MYLYKRCPSNEEELWTFMKLFQASSLWQLKMITIGIPKEIWFGPKVLIKSLTGVLITDPWLAPHKHL